MTRSIFAVFALQGIGLLGLALSGCGGTSPAPPPSQSPARGIVLRLQPGVDAAALAREYGLTLEDAEPENNLYRFRQQDDDREDRGALSERLRRDERFADAEPDEEVRFPEGGSVTGDPIHVPFDFVGPADSNYTALTTEYSAPTVNPASSQQVGLTLSRSIKGKRSGSIVVAVLDTGVQASHPALRDHLVSGYNAISPSALPDDVADGSKNQALGHGTMVSGVITQLAPEAKIMPVRVLNADGTGSLFSVVRGLRWAVAHGAHVVNLSLGTPSASRTLQGAIQEARRAGVVVVASAGNAGKQQRDYPAGFSDTIAVAAIDNTDQKASFSNYGSHITVSAPGTNIRSTFVNSTFATWSGTSFAAPFVAGAAALLRASDPELEVDEIADAIEKSARPIDILNPSYAGQLGRGVLSISGALTQK